jgi:hypothetical protein
VTANRDVIHTANATADDLSHLCTHLAHGLLQRLAEAEAGPAAARADRTSARGALLADPTAVAAMRGLDLAAAHRAELERCIGRARTAIRRALEIAAGYPEARAPDPGVATALARANDRADPGCESCARITGPAGVPRWEPPIGPLCTDVAGALPEPARLCRWCWDAVSRWGRLPTVEELARHHDGRRVSWPDDVERPA